MAHPPARAGQYGFKPRADTPCCPQPTSASALGGLGGSGRGAAGLGKLGEACAWVGAGRKLGLLWVLWLKDALPSAPTRSSGS